MEVNFTDLSHDPELRYICDFDSKVSQYKMQNYRSKYVGVSAAVVVLGVVADSFDRNSCNTQPYSLPRAFKRMRIINKTHGTLHVDVITDVALDNENSLSVKKIVLPKAKSISFLTVMDVEYELLYSWSADSIGRKKFSFSPAGTKKLLVTDEGVNKTVFTLN